MRYVDLSRPIAEGVGVYPGDPFFVARPFAEHAVDGFRGSTYVVGSHLGTHVDAPFHYFVDGETLDSFPVDFFIGEAACLDFAGVVGPESARRRERSDVARPVALDVADLLPFESILERVPILLLRVDWAQKVDSPDFYLDFPSLSPDVCDWLADFATLRLLGLETPSLVAEPAAALDEPAAPASPERDPFDAQLADLLPPSPRLPESSANAGAASADSAPFDELELCADAECHRILLGRRPPILILEGLVGLDQVPRYVADAGRGAVAYDPAKAFELSALPLPIVGADGSPARVVARIDD